MGVVPNQEREEDQRCSKQDSKKNEGGEEKHLSDSV